MRVKKTPEPAKVGAIKAALKNLRKEQRAVPVEAKVANLKVMTVKMAPVVSRSKVKEKTARAKPVN